MKTCLVVGTINRYPAPDGWKYVHVDASARPIYDTARGGPATIDVVADVRNMPFANESADRVQLWHVLEHLPQVGALAALHEIHRVLRPGGELDVEVPDIEGVVQEWVAGHDRRQLLQIIYGEPSNGIDPGLMAHRYGYWDESLAEALSVTGFDPGPRLTPDLRYRARRL